MKIVIHMRLLAKVPNHFWALDLPSVPHSVRSDIVLAFLPANVKQIDHYRLFDDLDGGRHVVLAEHGHDASHFRKGQFLLVCFEF